MAKPKAAKPAPARNLDKMLEQATELLATVQRLERGGAELDRQKILSRITFLSSPDGQPFRFEPVDGIELFANQSENVGRERPADEPDLAVGSHPSNAVLIALVRWSLTQWVNSAAQGHFKVEVSEGSIRAVPVDLYGDAMQRIAKLLFKGQPGSALTERRGECEWCGKEITFQRSTKRYCGNVCQQAASRARRRAHEEMS